MKQKVLLFLALLVSSTMAWAQGNGTADDPWISDDCNVTLIDNVLTVSKKDGTGNGAMADYTSESKAPWYSSASSITSVVINGGVTAIGYSAFENCELLTAIDIPASVKAIGVSAFNGCTNLASVTIWASKLETYGHNPFAGCSALQKIYVPSDAVETYQQQYWPEYADIIKAIAITSWGNCGKNGENCTYELYHNGLLRILGTGAMADYTSESKAPWYESCSDITAITINEGVTTIGNNAFENCELLTAIDIPASVETIGESAFYYCSGLQSITFAGNSQLTTIGKSAFQWCNNSNLTSITIPASVETIGEKAFDSCVGLQSISIPKGVTAIGKGVFNYCSSLETITVEDGNEKYESKNNALIEKSSHTLIRGCKDTTIPSDVTSIGDGAFSGISGLTSIEIPASVETIGESAFQWCSNLQSINIPASVKAIGINAFNSCKKLTSVTIWASELTTYGPYAFDNCTALANIYVPSDAVNTYKAAENWSGYQDIIKANDITSGICGKNCTYELYTNGLLRILGTGAMANDASYDIWHSSVNSITSVVIDNGVTTIGNSAFQFCSNLTSITIPASVETIGDYAFYSCSNLTSITIPASVETIGESAFFLCSGLQSITFAGNSQLTTIGNNAFFRCNNSNLTSITIPASVKTIGEKAFNSCDKLTSVTIWAPLLTTYGANAFYECTALQNIYVLSDAVETYQQNWSDYTSKITAIDNPAAVSTNAVTEENFAGNWCTYYNSNANVQVDEATTIYTISAASGTTATLSKASGNIIKAGEGVILKSTGSITLTYTTAAAIDAAYEGNLLEGVDAQTTISTSAYKDKVIYTMANGTDGLGFYKYYASDYTTNTTLAANKAFLALDAAVAASTRGFVFTSEEDETTGINENEELRMKNEEFAPAVYYDLQGRRVDQPTKGLYIKDGKKVVIK